MFLFFFLKKKKTPHHPPPPPPPRTPDRIGRPTTTPHPGQNLVVPLQDRVGRKINLLEQV
ncbi:hypothetical protein LXA35_18020, partial [Erwinia amylovora]|nr:hypothetical protein [Erwinia amylovora]